MIQKHIANLKADSKAKRSKRVGSNPRIYPPDKNGKGGGRSVAANARFRETGGIIEHPGGTKYITDAIVKKALCRHSRAVSNSFTGEHKITKAHRIVVPARPFMRLAWQNFYNNRSAIQKKIAGGLVSGKIKPDAALHYQIGIELENYIAESIKNGGWTPNAAFYTRKKEFNKPLADSSLIPGSITSKVI